MDFNSNSSPFSISNALLFIGIMGVLGVTQWKTNYGYNGETLSVLSCTVTSRPEKISGSQITAHYQFQVKEYFAQFWMVETAIKVYEEANEKGVSIQPGDSLTISIPNSSINLLNNPLNTVYVWGIKRNGQLLIDPIAIKERDSKTTKLFYGISAGLLAIGLILKIRKINWERP